MGPWLYRNLIDKNSILNPIQFYVVDSINNDVYFEAICSLKNKSAKYLKSEIYTDLDGSGASKYKNIAVYKSISEALERWAFREMCSDSNDKYCFNVNPSTTGIAAYPSFFTNSARENAKLEAIERWALYEFWRGNLPIIEHYSSIKNLNHYEIISGFNKSFISLISYKVDLQTLYAFAAGKTLQDSLNHAIIELDRNRRVMQKKILNGKIYKDFENINDKRLVYFSTNEGASLFYEKISLAPKKIKSKPKVICDQELKGPWSKYAKVWRYLYADSYPVSDTDHTFFMF